jgi:hypothetical protein
VLREMDKNVELRFIEPPTGPLCGAKQEILDLLFKLGLPIARVRSNGRAIFTHKIYW